MQQTGTAAPQTQPEQPQTQSEPTGLQATTQVLGSFFGGLGRMFASAVKTTIDSEREAIAAESKKNECEHNKMVIPDATVPPWEDLGPNVDQETRERIKMLVSELSKSRNTFIPAQPIDESKFVFNFDAAAGSARASLEKDKALDEMRNILVPRRVSENTFWKNWFWNVHLIKVSCGVEWPTPGIALPLLSPEEKERLQEQYSVDASDVALEVEMQAALQGMEKEPEKKEGDEKEEKKKEEEEKGDGDETKKSEKDAASENEDDNEVGVDLDDDGNITVSVANPGDNDSTSNPNWDNDIEVDI